MSNVSETMRGILGKPLETVVSFPIAASDIRRWAMAVYYPERPPRQFWDENSEEAKAWGGILAPDEFNPFAWMSADRKGPDATPLPADPAIVARGATEHLLGVEPPKLYNGLNGGIEVVAGAAVMRPGDVITDVASISEYNEREGRLGLMLFTTSDHVWTNQRGEHVKTVRTTFIRY